MTDITYMGQVNGTRAALARMRPRDRGVIVNVCSAMSYRSIPLQSAYCGAEHAVKGFSESIMTELMHEKSKVKVCMIQLPGLNTAQFDWNLNKMPKHPMPVAPVFQPELPAKGIVFLAEHPRRNMWIGVSTAYTNLGERIAPKLADFYLARTGIHGQQTGKTYHDSAQTSDNPATKGTTKALTAHLTTRPTPRIPSRGSRCIDERSSPAPAPPPSPPGSERADSTAAEREP